MAKSKFAVAGLIAACLMLGCNLPGQMPTGQSRVVVHYGSIDLAPNADLALVLDVRNLLGNGYKVQQATPGSGVKRLTAKVNGAGLAEPVVASVELIDCANGLATLNFTNLPPGAVEVVVNAIDFGGQPVAWASGKAVIRPNQTAQITLKCSSAGGGLAIDFDCPELCDTNPTPTPLPTPTPTPVDPASRLLWASTFDVDGQGNVYLYGWDVGTNLWGGQTSTTGNAIKIDGATLQINPANVFSDFRHAHDSEIIDGKLYMFQTWDIESSYIRAISNFDTPPGQLATTMLPTRPGNYNFTAITGKQNKHLVYTEWYDGANTTDMVLIKTTDPQAPTVLSYGSTLLPNDSNTYYPNSIAWDHQNNRPLWASSTGIHTIDSTASNPTTAKPKTLLQGLAANLESLGPLSTKFLYTNGGPKVYMFDGNAPGTPQEVLDVGTNQFVNDLRVSPSGQVYAMWGRSAYNLNGVNWRGTERYFITKYELNPTTNKLEVVQQIAKSGY